MAEGGFGVTFNIGSGALASTPTYTAIAAVESWNGVEIEAIMSEATHHGSTNGFAEHVPSGKFKQSPIELGLGFDITEETHDNASGGLIHALLNKTLLAYQMVLPDASNTTFTFDAYVSKIKWESAQEEHIKAMVTLQPTGSATLS